MKNINTKWNKNCPKCGRKQSYSCKSVLTTSIKENRICIDCTINKRKKHFGIFERICPKCGKLLKYICRQSLNISIKHNGKCRKCATKESVKLIDRSFQKTEEYRKKMSLSCSGKKISNKTKEKLSLMSKKQWLEKRDKILSVIQSKKYRIKMSKSIKKRWKNEIFKNKMNKIFNNEKYKQKRREIKLNTLKTKFNGKLANYNPKACQFIDKLNKEKGWNLQHALSFDGEKQICGFLVDGLDEKRNIIFEYDEPHHYDVNGNLKSKDIYRQNVIIEKYNPKEFWRYDEKRQNLYEVIIRKEK